jgi:hypothetical protein
MIERLNKDYLRRLRNEIEIQSLISTILTIDCKMSEGRFRFLCPICNEFNTAVNPKTNLARCFRCERNFNPIDMVITVKACAFLDAVDFLGRYAG